MLRIFKWGFCSLFVVLFVVFAVANRTRVLVSLHPLPFEIHTPLFLFGLLCVLVGAVCGWMLMAGKILRLKSLYRHAHNRAQALENERRASEMDKTVLPAPREAA